MDDDAKQVSSYQLDQEILDARGIDMTVDEVATLSTCKYAERVAALRLAAPDLALLKSLRRRIKNRLASQNSRRRSVEHLRRLTRELRVVRARRAGVLAERRELTARRDDARARCHTLRAYIAQVLDTRCDSTTVPCIDQPQNESQPRPLKIVTVTETKTPLLSECFQDKDSKIENEERRKIDRDKPIFECCLDKIVQNSVNHIYKNERDKKKIFAKTVFISNEKQNATIKSLLASNVSQPISGGSEKCVEGVEENGVLNLSVKATRRTHGRKQSAPRRIPYPCIENDDAVILDLKIKKEPQ